MPTSIYLPKPLLDALDRRARAMRLSRNRLIVRALERELSGEGDWSPHFFERLEEPGVEVVQSVDEMLDRIRTSRRSKPAPQL